MRAIFTSLVLAVVVAMAGCGGDSVDTDATSTTGGSEIRCPKNVPISDSFDARTLIGVTLAKARIEARKYRCEVRPVSVDGRQLANVQDTREDRVNVALEQARITRIIGVY